VKNSKERTLKVLALQIVVNIFTVCHFYLIDLRVTSSLQQWIANSL